MMPTVAQAEEDALARRRRMFEPPPVKVTIVPDRGSPPGVTADAWQRLVAAWWAKDRAARIARGACGECGERLCPKVGGKDAACRP